MARPLRYQAEDVIYHVNTVAVRRSELFPDDAAREMFLDILGVAVGRFRWRCGCYCLMGSHYHLLLQTLEANIGRGMQFLNGVYAQWFNLTFGERGHVFMSRYHDVVVHDESQLYRAFRYIVLNPVRAGICADPVEWPWSSYPALARVTRPRRLLDEELLTRPLSDDATRGRRALCAMVEELGWPDDWAAPGEARLERRGSVTGSDPVTDPSHVASGPLRYAPGDRRRRA